MSNPTLKLVMLWAGILLTSPYMMAQDCQRACTKQILCEIENDLDKLLACGASTPITQADLGTTGFTITEPGNYCIAEDITFDPAGNGVVAITIAPNVNNVNIYFNGHVLAQDPASTTLNNFGITIDGPSQNISISGGTIQGFSGTQILAQTINTFNLSDMLLQGIPQSGGGARIDAAHESAIGINLQSSVNVVLSNVEINTIFLNIQNIPGLFAFGIQMENCRDIFLHQTSTNNIENFGLVTNTTDSNCAGTIFFGCTNIVVEDCQSHDNHAFTTPFNGLVTGDAFGFSFQYASENVQCIGCSAYNNGGTRRCDGFVVERGTSSCVLEGCQAQGNVVVDPTAAGVASHYGFEVVTVGGWPTTENVVIKDCHVNGQPNCFAVVGAKNVLIQNCTATAEDIFTFTSQQFGFALFQGNGCTIEDCIAVGFEAHNGDCGFLLDAFNGTPSFNNNIRRCKAMNNNIGIKLSLVGFTVVQANEAAFNTANGFFDNSDGLNKTQAYFQNIAYGNGPDSFAANYSGLPAGTPIRTWSIGSAPTAKDNNGILDPQLDNMSIIFTF